ncbi:MAG: endonuclease VII domain-containing protein [Actinomycetes bacterium]
MEEFVRNRSTRTGLGTYCRPCQNEKSAESIARLHGNTRHYHLRRRYGLGADDVLRMLEEQARRCALCFRDVSAATVHVDHDHVTGKVRGLVCFNCNGGLGQFKDNAAVVRRAADYLDGQHLRLRREQPGVVRLVYPEPTETEVLPEPSDRPQLLDIAALRAKARGA